MGETRRSRNTKVVATIGPASGDPDTLYALLQAGVDVCRINCSHSTAEMIQAEVSNIRRQASATSRPVSILLDLQGPKIRLETFAEGSAHLRRGQEWVITTRDVPGHAEV